MNKIQEILENVKSGWNNMDRKKKVAMISVVLLIFISVTLFTYFNRVTYAPLFTNLDLDDSGRIVEDLKTKKIDYKLENGGQDIHIDEKLIDGYRLEVATEGNMPEKSSGFEMFDNMGMMATDEDRQIMYQRAISGELQRSIMSLDGVKAAKVHLVLPEKSIFETEKKPGSASVIVDIDPSTKINNDTIRGMAALVYGAVEDVPQENIQIIDSKGNLLSSFLKDENKDGTLDLDGYSAMREEFQQKVEENLDQLLSGVFGRDKVKISVFADLDFDAEETTTISYEDPVTRSEQTTSMIEGGAGGNIGDADTNVVGDVEEDGTLIDRTINNELTTETKTTIKAPGKVRKLTTSVVYDGNLAPEAEDQMLSIVAAATGYDVDRGDFISIEGINFDRTYEEELARELAAIEEEEAAGEEGLLGQYRNYLIYGLAGLFILLLIAGVIRTILARRRKEEDPFPEEFPMDVPISELEQAIIKETPEEEVIEKIEVKKDINQIKANEFAEENPDVAADLIKAWMKE